MQNVHFSPDGKYLVIDDDNQTTRIWELVEEGIWKKKIILTHKFNVAKISFSPNGEYLAIAFVIGCPQIWGLLKGRWEQKITINNEFVFFGSACSISTVQFSPDGKYLVTASHRCVHILEPVNGEWKVKKTIIDAQEDHVCIHFSHDGHYCAVGSNHTTFRGGIIRILELVKGEWEEQCTCSCESNIVKAQFSPDRKHLVTLLSNGIAQIFELVEETVVPASCTTLVTTAMAQTVHLGGKPHQTLEASSKVCELAKDSGTTSFIDQGVKRAKIAVERKWKKKVIIKHEGNVHTSHINDVNFSPSGNYLVTTSYIAKIWELVGEKWQQIAILASLGTFGTFGTFDRMLLANFSSDESHIVTASSQKNARVWGRVRKKWQEKARIIPFTKRSDYASFSSDGLYLVTGCRHETNILTLESKQNSNAS